MAERPPHEVAEIFDRYLSSQGQGVGPSGPSSWSWEQRVVVDRIRACRTARLGGRVYKCDACGKKQISYNSCRNRHCPKCQGGAQAAWLVARQADVLPVPYAHVVFTMPQRLAPLALQNQRIVYGLLLRTVAQTLQEIARNPKHLGARLGFFAILHTWGQSLVHHPHVHCVVPAGGLADDGTWRPCRPGFFLPVRVLSRLFRGKFVAGLRAAFRENHLEFHGALAQYHSSAAFQRLLSESLRTEWVVFAKPPLDDPGHVLKYLARYTHRIAISNHRILGVTDQSVTFRYNDYRSRRPRSLQLTLAEFTRRFLLHVLPKGFVRIRYYGLLASAGRVKLLARCRCALGQNPPPQSVTNEALESPLGVPAARLCPICRRGCLVCIDVLARPPPLIHPWSHVAA